MKRKFLIGVVASSMLLSACRNTAAEPVATPPVEQTDVQEDSQDSSTDDASLEDVAEQEDDFATEDITDYYSKYYEYMLNNPEENLIFSPESFNSALAMYSQLLVPGNRAEFDALFGNKNYLNYESIDGLKFVNRLWINSDKNINLQSDALRHNPFVYPISMHDSGKATQEKNQFVADNTDNFIMSTPSVLSDEILFDAMSIVYFKDKWLGGDKMLDDDTTAFTNKDGSVSDVHMFNDNGSYILKSSDAVGYELKYKNGMTCTVILPNEGVSLDNVNIDAFIRNEVEYESATVYAKFPEFEAQCMYNMNLTDFGFSGNPMINPEIIEESSDMPSIIQVAKIKFDHEGTEAAAVTEVMVTTAAVMEDPQPVYEFVVDRPFAYYITDTTNDDIAFMGVVQHLESEE